MMITTGTRFEYRLRRLLFHEGYFTRSGVELRAHFSPDRVDVTDLDVLALSFAVPTRVSTLIVDCKSGDAKAPERILWLSGLCKYMGADQGLVAKSRLSLKVKQFAREAGLISLDAERIKERESELGIDDNEWIGSFSIELMEERKSQLLKGIGKDERFRRFVRFIIAEFWYEDNYIRLKKLCSGIQTLMRYWVEEIEDERVAVYRWLLLESLILLTICILYIARDVYGLKEDEATQTIRTRLAAGVARIDELERLASRVNDYVRAVLTETKGVAGALEAPSFFPEPPPYTDGIIDLVLRFRAQPAASATVPRFQDILLYEFGLWGRHFDPQVIDQFGFLNPADALKQTLNVGRFMERYLRVTPKHLSQILPRSVIDGLLSGRSDAPQPYLEPALSEQGQSSERDSDGRRTGEAHSPQSRRNSAAERMELTETERVFGLSGNEDVGQPD